MSISLRDIIVIIAFGFFCGTSKLYSQTINTLTIDFVRNVKHHDVSESQSGTIFFEYPDKMLVKTKMPILQWMIFESNSLLIYYPDEQKIIKINTKNPTTLPFFQAFQAVSKSDFGLSEVGFSLQNSGIKNDTLEMTWIPPSELKKHISLVTIKLAADKIVSSVTRDTRGRNISDTRYSDHVNHGGQYFPLTIITKIYESNKISYSEEIKFSNPVFNSELPDDIINFELPADIIPHEIEW
ncbi:MAG: hypothetical protein P9L92_12645 [Candidatus Electryonea clarkiae]|nr:hypothetical protein [Candidatus Electryonea clarkiae]MDP8285037.1 hypothetical protein [Candidatus Electryonea clarkiae]